MTDANDPWENLPDDKRVYLTKADIDNIMTSMLHVQLLSIYASGCIRALKEKDEAKYEDAWNKVKVQVFESRDLMFNTLRQIAERNQGESDA